MKGLELAEKYYEAYGRKMLAAQFPEAAQYAAAGLAGHGSECFGFDDGISMDHDYGPSFCIWLPRDVYEQYGAKMQAAYDALPGEFMGFAARRIEEQGAGRVGVLCLEDFYLGLIGRDTPPVSVSDWLALDESSLAAAVNGRVFEDRLGWFSAMRKSLTDYYPREAWLRRLAQSMGRAAQAGQYNYARAMKRGDRLAAEMALTDFIRESMRTVYLLNRTYAPYDKWLRRGLRELPSGSEIGDMLDLLYTVPDPAGAWADVSLDDYLYCLNTGDGRVLIIEAVCGIIVQMLNETGLSELQDNFLQAHLGTILAKI